MKNPITFFWYFAKKEPIAFAVFFSAPVLIVLEAIIMPYALKMVIDAFNTYEDSRQGIMAAITPALLLGANAWFTLLVLIRLQEWWQVHVLPRFEANIRMWVLEYLTQHSYSYFSRNMSGNLSNKVSDLPRSLDALFMNIRWNVIATFAVVITGLCIISTINLFFTGLIIIWVIADVTLSFLFVHYIHTAAEENAEDKSQLSGRIVDTLSNMTSVRIFSRCKAELGYIGKAQAKEKATNAKLKWRIMIFHMVVDIPVTLMWIPMGYLLIDAWQTEQITTGDLVFIFNSIWAMMFRLWFLGEALAEMFKDYGIAQQALSLILQPHEIVDAKDAKQLEVKKGRIAFDDVTFHYNEGQALFKNKNIVIEPGQKVGLVGFSGSGKTSFVHLILRFFDVESGTIRIDEQNISQVTQHSLREHIALIPQDTTLFHRTIMENIHYGNPDASEEDVILAAKKAHCHEFITQLEEGYHTMTGERGVRLSGGQRQRIAIARAILKDAPILILDEATSALDSMTEKHIQEGLEHVMQDRTTLVIAHRLSTLAEMDRILVFDKGQIIEDGDHSSLVTKKDGHYARMWQMQAGGFLPEVQT